MYDIKTIEKKSSKSNPDTSNLDKRFLVEEDVSDNSIADIAVHRQLSATGNLLHSLLDMERIRNIKEQPILKAELESIWGDFAQKAADRLNKALRQTNSEINKQKEHMEKEGKQK
jgi:hypothetical protein